MKGLVVEGVHRLALQGPQGQGEVEGEGQARKPQNPGPEAEEAGKVLKAACQVKPEGNGREVP